METTDNNIQVQEQRSNEWYKARLGNITGSSVGKLMSKGRAKDAIFSATGISYLMQVAAERMIPIEVISSDEEFACYLDEVNVTSKAMRIGTERESEARELYTAVSENEVTENGSIKHPSIDHFASSPDGQVTENGIKGCIEIKCPAPATYIDYLANIKDAEGLKAVKPEYYWQCMAHLACTGAKFCDFVAYCPYNVASIHIVRINRDEAAIAEMEDKVKKGLEFIDNIVNNNNPFADMECTRLAIMTETA